MPFLTPDAQVERWLFDAATDFRPLSQEEYLTFVAEGRSRFEAPLMNGDRLVGKPARRAALERLPIDGVVFSMPGYRWLLVLLERQAQNFVARRDAELAPCVGRQAHFFARDFGVGR